MDGVRHRRVTNLERFDAFNWVEPGNTIELSVKRDGRPVTLNLIAAEMPDDVALKWRARRAQLVQVT